MSRLIITSAVKKIMSFQDHPTLRSNLVGLYPLNETTGTTINDVSGNGNHGTYVNSPTLNQSGGVPNLGNCVQWGSGKHGTIVKPHGWSAITITAWAKTNTNPNNYAAIVLSRAGSGIAYGLGVNPSPTFTPRFEAYYVDGAGGAHGTSNIVSGGYWWFLAATYDGSYSRIYANAVLEGENANNLGNISCNDYLKIGIDSQYPTSRFWPRWISQVGVWNRALNLYELKSVYNAGNGLPWSI
ncbi:MAG: LamG domain-containing protein [Lentimicrobiaceae bacterium]|nr:LamG domain-containing protein [Lentimicrobiaceae bacterium]